MNDILYIAAQTFKKINEYDYNFILGNSRRQITIACTSSDKGEFTHIVGLDHLTDIPAVTANTIWQKEAVYNNILKKKILFSQISKSQFINGNSNPDQTFDIKKRITMFRYAEIALENAYTGKFLKWNSNKSNIMLSNGKKTCICK